MNHNYFKSLAVAGALISLYLVPATFMSRSYTNTTKDDGTVVVGTGKLGYNNGNLESKGLYDCSAVIFNYGTKAVMAHAYPETYRTELDNIDTNTIFADNAVTKIIDESHARGLDLENVRVTIDAGNGKSLAILVNDLHKANIAIKRIITHQDSIDGNPHYTGRDVQYYTADDSVAINTYNN